MKFTCEKAELQAAVSVAARAASPRSPIPALEGILLEAGTDRLKLTGYDLKKGIYTAVPAAVTEPGNIVLSARVFGSIVNSLPDGTVTLQTEGSNNSTSIRCGSAAFNITGSDAADYPELPEIDGPAGVSLPQDLLSRMIRQTIFAVSDNESRPVYTGELFEIGGGRLTLVAVDGYRLALRRENVGGVEGEYTFIVPGGALSDVEKLCGDTEDEVRIGLGSKHISFRFPQSGTVLISRRLDGDFLDYKKTVPTEFGVKVLADRAGLQRTIERVSLVIDDRIKNPLRCTFDKDEVRFACATGVGKAEDVFGVEGDGGGMVIGFNNRYLLDALKAAPADAVRICLNSGSSPCVFEPAEGTDGFLYMILPVRLKQE